MKENVLDVLMYLYDNYLREIAYPVDECEIAQELKKAGFKIGEITEAFDWLDALADLQMVEDEFLEVRESSTRILSAEEKEKLDLPSRCFLSQLEAIGVLVPKTREIILDRMMTIPNDQLSLAEFKRIVGFVLLNYPPSGKMLSWIEALIVSDGMSGTH